MVSFLPMCTKYKKTIPSSEHIIYLVRHAEKADDGTKDPPLNLEGEKRAKNLSNLLENKGITKIYSTNYKRTMNTALPLSNLLKIPTEIYDPRDTSFYNKIRKDAQTNNVLVVGHSNTTPSLTNYIIGQDKYRDLEESTYNQIFLIKVINNTYQSSIEFF